MNGKNGLLGPVGDTDGLAKQLCALAEDEKMCTHISQEAIKIREILDENAVLEQWKRLL